jgi:HKD family nuclease
LTYSAKAHAQDPVTGRTDVVISVLANTSKSLVYDRLDAAVAYATARGVDLLDSRLTSGRWQSAVKRWLVSIDFGITEPAALDRLAMLPNSEVRIPNGKAIISGGSWLYPPSTFHTKGYIFRSSTASSPLGLIIGSANLTVSALAVGAEAITVQKWDGLLSSSETALLMAQQDLLAWFEEQWIVADPSLEVLPTYRQLYTPRRGGVARRDDRTLAAKAYTGIGSEVAGRVATQLSLAKALWFETDQLYHNRGVGQPGNQLDTPRGTRVFFGFSGLAVPTNTVLGEVEMHVPGHLPVIRTVRYGNNQMDKVNLPVPGSDGPPSYDHSFLLFERQGSTADGRLRFRLQVLDTEALRARRQQAVRAIDLAMTGGRRYGLFF